jgi:hypothetical protein
MTPCSRVATDLQQLSQFVATQRGVADDSVERASLQLAMERNDQRDRALGVLEPNVASPLPDLLPALLLECLDQLRAR